jgi:hypothetical protein
MPSELTVHACIAYNSANMYKAIDPKGYGIAKAKVTGLMKDYEPFFAPLVGQAISLFELGIHKGASLRFWRDYFEDATVVGLDCNPVRVDDSTGMIRVYQGYQQDRGLLDRIAQEQAPQGFDVIIDDCSHIGRFARISFWHLFQNHLKPGGLYAIEDWRTGYIRSWPDGRHYKPKSRLMYALHERMLIGLSAYLSRQFPNFPSLANIPIYLVSSKIPSHTHGMVGFAKELLDGCALGERAIPQSGTGRYLEYGISQIHISTGLIIVVKSRNRDAFKSNTTLSKDGRLTRLAQKLISEEDGSD